LVYIVGSFLLELFSRRFSGQRLAGLLVALLIPFVPFITASPGGVIVGYADIPISVFYAVATGYLLCSLQCNLTYSFSAYVAVLTLIPWIKSEGVILWALLALMGIVVALVK